MQHSTLNPKALSFIKSESAFELLKPSESLKINPSNYRVEKTGKVNEIYQSLELVGKGGYGEIRKVRNRITNEIRAVKIIAKDQAQMIEFFSEEINILKQLV